LRPVFLAHLGLPSGVYAFDYAAKWQHTAGKGWACYPVTVCYPLCYPDTKRPVPGIPETGFLTSSANWTRTGAFVINRRGFS
jgi:hypothetical protein